MHERKLCNRKVWVWYCHPPQGCASSGQSEKMIAPAMDIFGMHKFVFTVVRRGKIMEGKVALPDS
jgi:hypothetical protein